MDSPVLFALNLSTLVIIIFSANLLLLRATKRQVYFPLGLCFLCIGIVVCQPTLTYLLPNLRPNVLILALPAVLLIAPCFWFYVEGITAKSPWQIKAIKRRHFILSGLGVIIALLAVLLPPELKYSLLIEGNENVLKDQEGVSRYVAVFCLIATLILVLAWVVQSGFYFIKIVNRLRQYRLQLKNVFASTDTKEVRWLSWVMLAIGLVWTAAAVNIVLDNLFFTTQYNATVAHAVILIMIWSVALWGLRQKPGLEELYSENEAIDVLVDETTPPREKYQRSALEHAQSQKIAEKLDVAMKQDKLYLDASLSLPKLAKKIGSTPNYISQTLNGQLNTSFFDYINHYRVLEAKERLTNTEDTVVDIAMAVGFNAKSSFYSAFKKETQQTPSQFRKSGL